MIEIHGEIMCQSWQLLTQFYSGPIVHAITFLQKGLEVVTRWQILEGGVN